MVPWELSQVTKKYGEYQHGLPYSGCASFITINVKSLLKKWLWLGVEYASTAPTGYGCELHTLYRNTWLCSGTSPYNGYQWDPSCLSIIGRHWMSFTERFHHSTLRYVYRVRMGTLLVTGVMGATLHTWEGTIQCTLVSGGGAMQPWELLAHRGTCSHQISWSPSLENWVRGKECRVDSDSGWGEQDRRDTEKNSYHLIPSSSTSNSPRCMTTSV